MGSSRIERLIIGRGGKLNGKFGKILYFFFSLSLSPCGLFGPSEDPYRRCEKLLLS